MSNHSKVNNKLNYHRNNARCGCRSLQPKSIIWNLSPVYNLCPLNSPTQYIFIV